MSDPLEKVIRPIVEGQLRGFVKEHPGVLTGVTWYKGKKHGQVATFVNSVAKRIVRDLLCPESRERIEQALFELWEIEKSAVEIRAAADSGEAGSLPGPSFCASVAPASADGNGMAGTAAGHPASRALLPQVEWVRA